LSKVYFSVDLETDGLVAGRNNMLSLGAVAIDMDNGHIVARFKENLSTVPSLSSDADTMHWWRQFPEAYVAARVNAIWPSLAMTRFVKWVDTWKVPESVIFAWKPVMDLAFLRYYIHAFHPNGAQLCTQGVFSRHCFGMDQKTVAALALKQPFRYTRMDSLPDSLRLNEQGEIIEKHSHDALEDAEEQALIFYNSIRRLGVEL
jgi:3' exoribonuclease, RNase T-like